MKQQPLFGRLPDPAGKCAEPFARFWAVYPARPGNPKAEAAKVFRHLVERGGVPADTLIAATETYAAEVRRLGTGAAFIPHAATWLRQERFRDYLTDPAAPPTVTPAAADPTAGHPLSDLAPEIGLPAWRSWIEPLWVTETAEKVLIVAPSRFHAARVERDYASPLHRLFPGRRLYFTAGGPPR